MMCATSSRLDHNILKSIINMCKVSFFYELAILKNAFTPKYTVQITSNNRQITLLFLPMFDNRLKNNPIGGFIQND
jgi:hypothetical protein